MISLNEYAGADSSNKFAVGVRAGKIVINNTLPIGLTREEALNLAAWIIAVLDDDAPKTLLKISHLLGSIKGPGGRPPAAEPPKPK